MVSLCYNICAHVYLTSVSDIETYNLRNGPNKQHDAAVPAVPGQPDHHGEYSESITELCNKDRQLEIILPH